MADCVGKDLFSKTSNRELDERLHRIRNLPEPEFNLPVIRQCNVDLSGTAFVSMDVGNWIDGDAVDCYLQMAAAESSLPVTVITSMFFKAVTSHGPNTTIKRYKNILKSVDTGLVLLPCSFFSTHWVMCRIDRDKGTIQVYDSYNHELWSLQEQLQDLSEAVAPLNRSGHQYELSMVRNLPIQPNGFDCGAYIIGFAYCIMNDLPINFDQAAIKDIRKNMSYRLLQDQTVVPRDSPGLMPTASVVQLEPAPTVSKVDREVPGIFSYDHIELGYSNLIFENGQCSYVSSPSSPTISSTNYSPPPSPTFSVEYCPTYTPCPFPTVLPSDDTVNGVLQDLDNTKTGLLTGNKLDNGDDETTLKLLRNSNIPFLDRLPGGELFTANAGNNWMKMLTLTEVLRNFGNNPWERMMLEIKKDPYIFIHWINRKNVKEPTIFDFRFESWKALKRIYFHLKTIHPYLDLTHIKIMKKNRNSVKRAQRRTRRKNQTKYCSINYNKIMNMFRKEVLEQTD